MLKKCDRLLNQNNYIFQVESLRSPKQRCPIKCEDRFTGPNCNLFIGMLSLFYNSISFVVYMLSKIQETYLKRINICAYLFFKIAGFAGFIIAIGIFAGKMWDLFVRLRLRKMLDVSNYLEIKHNFLLFYWVSKKKLQIK